MKWQIIIFILMMAGAVYAQDYLGPYGQGTYGEDVYGGPLSFLVTAESALFNLSDILIAPSVTDIGNFIIVFSAFQPNYRNAFQIAN